jgi:hypothetical protein
MPDNHRRTPHPVSVTCTITYADLAKLEARAALLGVTRAQALRSLIAALPAPSPVCGAEIITGCSRRRPARGSA